MFDRPIIALKDEEEMEDFHDYDDEEHAEMDSKLDDYEDDDDDEEEIAPPPVAEPVVAAIAEPPITPGPPAEAAPGTPAKKPVGGRPVLAGAGVVQREERGLRRPGQRPVPGPVAAREHAAAGQPDGGFRAAHRRGHRGAPGRERRAEKGDRRVGAAVRERQPVIPVAAEACA